VSDLSQDTKNYPGKQTNKNIITRPEIVKLRVKGQLLTVDVPHQIAVSQGCGGKKQNYRVLCLITRKDWKFFSKYG